MNLHEIPAFTQNYSMKRTCCVPEAVMMLYLDTVTKPKNKNKIQRKKYFPKNRISPFSYSSSLSSFRCHGLAVIWDGLRSF